MVPVLLALGGLPGNDLPEFGECPRIGNKCEMHVVGYAIAFSKSDSDLERLWSSRLASRGSTNSGTLRRASTGVFGLRTRANRIALSFQV